MPPLPPELPAWRPPQPLSVPDRPFAWGLFIAGVGLAIPVLVVTLIACGFLIGLFHSNGSDWILIFPPLIVLAILVVLIARPPTRTIGLGLLTGVIVIPGCLFIGCAAMLGISSFSTPTTNLINTPAFPASQPATMP